MKPYFDCHCHVFDRKETVNLRQIIKILLTLPKILAAPAKSISASSVADDIKEKANLLKRIINFLKTGISDSEQSIFEQMEIVYQGNYNIMPLMFDLECCFVSNRSGSKKLAPVSFFLDRVKATIDNFIGNHENFIDDILNLTAATPHSDITGDTAQNLIELNRLHSEVCELLNGLEIKQLSLRSFNLTTQTNFDIQLQDIKQLKKNNPDTVYPFFAIDPRRQGIIDKFINAEYPQKIFTGVKLYAPNGYSPTDDDLMKPGSIYDFCSKNNIPVTVHNAFDGFATPLEEVEIFGDIYDVASNSLKPVHGNVTFSKFLSDGWVQDRADKLNNPMLWEKVLTEYPNLKLNLAHFGLRNSEWQDRIFTMMGTFKNLYTDLSCWTNRDELIAFRNNYFLKAGDDIKSRILYGSDYYLDLLFIDSFESYFNNFKSVFTPDELIMLSQTNPLKFI
jgi:predicted TIM-barrel fold metal-dependent hydrolase